MSDGSLEFQNLPLYTSLWLSKDWYVIIHQGMLAPKVFRLNASISSKHEHPAGQTPGEFFEVVKSPAQGQNFPAKAWASGKNNYPRGVF